MFFFFSSRRRHTRCSRDWSSDVCSSDLKIKVLHAIGPNVGLGTRIGAVAEVGALSEYRSVKPLSQPLIERTRGQMRQRGSDRSGAARVGNAGVAEGPRAPADDDREATLECDDGVDSPPADQLIGNSVHVACILLAPPKRQVQNGCENQALRNVEGIQAALAAEIVWIRSEERRVGKECRSRWSPYH